MDYIADSFFHFTSKFDYLVSIIENGFFPRYCFEEYDFLLGKHKEVGRPTEFGVPMVCFCDIPPQFINEHASEFGKFAIAMNKDWGKRELCPILYIKENTIPANNLINIQWYLFNNYNIEKSIIEKDTTINNYTKSKKEDELLNNFSQSFVDFQDFIGFVKKYEGISGKTGEKKEFYREREWRWIPRGNEKAKAENRLLRLGPDEKNDELSLEKHNNTLKEYHTLKIKPIDIDYYIVDTVESKERLENDINDKYNKFIKSIYTLDEIKENPNFENKKMNI
jgi:hypothetical protein